MMDLGYKSEHVKISVGAEDGDLLQAMMDDGIKQEEIPTTLGGGWSYASMLVWCRERAREERQALKKMKARGQTGGGQRSSGASSGNRKPQLRP